MCRNHGTHTFPARYMAINHRTQILTNKYSTICPAGTYQPLPHLNLSVMCSPCIGRYIDDGGTDDALHNSEADCKFCPAGKRFVSIEAPCTVCGAGKYQNSNTAAGVGCTTCAGKFIEDPGLSATEHDAADDCKTCPLGFELYDGDTTRCHICGAGTYQDQEGAAYARCSPCPADTYLTDDKKLWIAHTSQSDCVACSMGKFASPGARECGTWYVRLSNRLNSCTWAVSCSPVYTNMPTFSAPHAHTLHIHSHTHDIQYGG